MSREFETELTENAEAEASAALQDAIKRERVAEQGHSDEELTNLADDFLRQHGLEDLIEKPELSLSLFEKSGVDIMREELDPDRRANILNDVLVQKEDGVATQDTIRDLVAMTGEAANLTTYRPDHIAALSPENLVAVARGFVVDREEEDLLLEAIKQTQKAAGETEGGLPTIDESEKILRADVLEELAERLHEDIDPMERRKLMNSLGNLSPEELQQLIDANMDLEGAILTHFQEIDNPTLREAITLSQLKNQITADIEEGRQFIDWEEEPEDEDEEEYEGLRVVTIEELEAEEKTKD